MLAVMASLLTNPVAATLLVLDETDGATLTEIARSAGKPLSTIQRAVDRLVRAHVVVRDSPRGRLRYAPDAPRHALRELAEWRLGMDEPTTHAQPLHSAPVHKMAAPGSIRNQQIRRVWPTVIRSIVSTYDPARVILFGSQARGDARPDSDVDLLVVFDDDLAARARRIGIRRLLRDMPFAKDVLVASVADLQHPIGGTAVSAALREGVVVYER